MKVADLMETLVQSVDPDANVSDVILVLADAHIHGVPVVQGRSRKLLGSVSTTDVLELINECMTSDDRDRLLDETTVREIMAPTPQTIRSNADVREAAQIMLYSDVHRLFVEDDQLLVGVISQSDIVRAVGTAKI